MANIWSPGRAPLYGYLISSVVLMLLFAPEQTQADSDDAQLQWAANHPMAAVNWISEIPMLALSLDGGTTYLGGSLRQEGRTPASDFATVAYGSQDGAAKWTARYNGPGNGADYVRAISATDSAVFVVGQSIGATGRSDYATVAYAASDGSLLWQQREQATDSFPKAAMLSPDGTVLFVTGTRYQIDESWDFFTIAYSTTDGNRLWTATYDWPGWSWDVAWTIEMSPDGQTLFVGGEAGPIESSDYAIVAYDTSSGTVRWVDRYNPLPGQLSSVGDVVIAPDGSALYVTGSGGTAAHDAVDGALKWFRSKPGIRAEGPSPIRASVEGAANGGRIAISPDGLTVAITSHGYTRTEHPLGWANFQGVPGGLLAYATNDGSQLWARGYPPTAGSSGREFAGVSPRALMIGPDGERLFVAGKFSDATGGYSDYVTLAYEIKTGRQLWATRYGSISGQEEAFDLQVAPDGSRVFVTGYGGTIMTTIAYRTTTCASGADEDGPLSGPIHEAEPNADPLPDTAAHHIHVLNCNTIVPAGG